jgi:hypothetical protein
MTYAVLLAGIRTTTDTLLGGQTLGATAQAPTGTEDGYVVTWNDGAGEYQLVAAAGGGDGIYGGSGVIPNTGQTTATLGAANTDSLIFKAFSGGPGNTNIQFGWENSGGVASTYWQNNGQINHKGNIVLTQGENNPSISVTTTGATVALSNISNSGYAGQFKASNNFALHAKVSGGASNSSAWFREAVNIGGSAPDDAAPIGMLTVENGDVRFLGAADANLFYLDEANDVIGIGASPGASTKLKVQGNSGGTTVVHIVDSLNADVMKAFENKKTLFSSAMTVGDTLAGSATLTLKALTAENIMLGKTSAGASVVQIDGNGNIDLLSTNVYKVGGNSGITEVLNFGGGGSGDVATMTIEGGIITGRTLVP